MSKEDWDSLQEKLKEQLDKNQELLAKIKEDRTFLRRKKPISKSPIKSCICCSYWKIQEEEKHLLIGHCKKKNGTKTDYGFICEEWEKI